ncbi:hypothetical protein E0Z10_g9038 [Xylaria hypoxylon]|uniref:F-box domain-containing protein n=1 Tax=Xylaria hypoxylon TaxID=37992 RepID=A0A4Z0YK32_9PEZI|nr:hypothetical protein E0Z10_g9038 [Xylaria hypoxylon]
MASTLAGLPMELMQEIITTSHSLEDIFNMSKTCKTMHTIFKAAEGLIIYTILSQKLDPSRLALAAAHHAAVKAPWKYDVDPGIPLPEDQTQYLILVKAFCSRYLSKQGTELLLPATSFTLPMGFYIEHFDTAIRNMSHSLTSDRIIPTPRLGVACLTAPPTPVELTMVSKAFYILDMVLHLFPRSLVTLDEHHGSDPLKHDKPFDKFWSLWKGIIGLDAIICDRYFSPKDEEILALLQDLRFIREFRHQIHQDQHRWFQRQEDPDFPLHLDPFYDMVIKFEVLQRYNVEQSYGTVLVWLFRCLRVITSFDWAWIFWDSTRLNILFQGRLPSLDDMHEIENHTINMDPNTLALNEF